jgi:hypothetical protein
LDAGRGALRVEQEDADRGGSSDSAFSNIKDKSFPELHLLVQQSGATMKLRDLLASISRLKSVPGASARQKVALLKQSLQLVKPQLQQCQPRGLAEIMLTCSQLGYGPASLYDTCLDAFLSKLHQADARRLANVVYALAKAPDASSKQQWGVTVQQQLLPGFIEKVGTATPQNIANVIWGVATMGQQLPAEQLQQLLAEFEGKLGPATPQNIANVVWGVATMGQQLPAEQLQEFLAKFEGKLGPATPQNIANVVWGLATMGQQVSGQRAQQLVGALAAKLCSSSPQAVANTMWGVARLQPQPFFPRPLLEAKAKQAIIRMVPDMIPQQLANIALACGVWGYRDEQLLLPLFNKARDDFLVLPESSSSRAVGASVQSLAKMCWAAAVLNMQQLVSHVEQFAAAISSRWEDAVMESMLQLYQVHKWLLDLDSSSEGLLGCLSEQQLQECLEQWHERMDRLAAAVETSRVHKAVQAAAAKLTGLSERPEQEAVTADGLHRIDVLVVTATGVPVAIEVDGHHRFRLPDLQPTGTTQWRNRSLAARGYVVVSVPYWEWNKLSASGRVKYLEAKIQQELAQAASTASFEAPAHAASLHPLLQNQPTLLARLDQMSMFELREVTAAVSGSGLVKVVTSGPGRTKAVVREEIRELLGKVLPRGTRG